MTGYVVVNANPFFAVTGPDGHFKIAGLPPGKYTLTAWQERYGAKTRRGDRRRGQTDRGELRLRCQMT